ncbi:hypothetical protein [Actinoplanes sp. RD1]|uniref:hypothetical protein n=1 Tax=Actinoplanes sp. RD1 TaxID=3064538 RepID=UPI0027425974|nr:hypothetical protein [Actinoplanes sp. RD1]
MQERLLDYYSHDAPWSRQLWRLSSVLELRELLEAARARHEGVLSDSAVKYLSDCLVNRVKRDVGLGAPSQRGRIVGDIGRNLVPGGHDAVALHLVTEQADGDYLRRWADEVRRSSPHVEVVSRAIGSYLLDAGFSRTALHKWWTYHGKHAPDTASIADLIDEAVVLVRRPFVRFTVCVPLPASPPLPMRSGVHQDQGWLTSRETSDWLSRWVPSVPPIRQSGALLLEIDARDVHAAIEKAATTVARLVARFRVGMRERMEFLDQLFVIGYDAPFEYAMSPRRFELHALHKTSAVFDLDLPAEFDAVLELLEPLDGGAPAAAVAGSWAALEALFVGPGDGRKRVIAANRIARVVACSYVRAELTALANACAIGDDELATAIRGLPENADRAKLFEDALKAGAPVSFERTRHRLALDRMRALITDPGRVLPRIVAQLEDAFRRLYRQRNLVVHAGDLTSVALAGTLRTVAPLVGAGIDRIVHAGAVGGRSPLEVAALAETNLGRVADGDTRLVELLG